MELQPYRNARRGGIGAGIYHGLRLAYRNRHGIGRLANAVRGRFNNFVSSRRSRTGRRVSRGDPASSGLGREPRSGCVTVVPPGTDVIRTSSMVHRRKKTKFKKLLRMSFEYPIICGTTYKPAQLRTCEGIQNSYTSLWNVKSAIMRKYGNGATAKSNIDGVKQSVNDTTTFFNVAGGYISANNETSPLYVADYGEKHLFNILNNTQHTQIITIYDIICRTSATETPTALWTKDSGVAGASNLIVNGPPNLDRGVPGTTYQEFIKDHGSSVSYTTTHRLGSDPRRGRKFNQYYRVVKSIRKMVPAGGRMVHEHNEVGVRIIDGEFIQNFASDYIAGWTKGTMIIVQGELTVVGQVNSVNTNFYLTTNEGSVDILEEIVTKYKPLKARLPRQYYESDGTSGIIKQEVTIGHVNVEGVGNQTSATDDYTANDDIGGFVAGKLYTHAFGNTGNEFNVNVDTLSGFRGTDEL